MSTYLLTTGLILSSGSLASANSNSEAPENVKFDFVQKAAEQGYTASEQNLKTFIENKANNEGRTYDEVANEVFTEVQRIHSKYSDEPLYNDVTTEVNNSVRTLGSQSGTPLSSVTQSFVVASNSDYLLRKTSSIVSGGKLSIEFGVDSVIYSNGSFREFVSIDSGSAFVLPYGNGTHNWSPAYETATLESSTTVKFRAYGNLESTVSKDLSVGFELAGFSISDSTGYTVTLRKSHQINHTFSLY